MKPETLKQARNIFVSLLALGLLAWGLNIGYDFGFKAGSSSDTSYVKTNIKRVLR